MQAPHLHAPLLAHRHQTGERQCYCRVAGHCIKHRQAAVGRQAAGNRRNDVVFTGQRKVYRPKRQLGAAALADLSRKVQLVVIADTNNHVLAGQAQSSPAFITYLWPGSSGAARLRLPGMPDAPLLAFS